MIVISLILSLFIVFLSGVYWYQNWSRYGKLLNEFPRVWRYVPVLGNVLILTTKRDVLYKTVREVTGHFKETFSGWGGIYGTVHIVTADDAEIVLSNAKYIDKGTVYEFFHSWLGTGLLTSTGAKWHQRRKMLTPAFHYNILQTFVEIFGENSFKLTESLKEECDKSKTDIVPYIKQATLETICETSMGMQLEKNDESQAKYYEALNKIVEHIIRRAIHPWLHSDFINYFTPQQWKHMEIVNLLHKFTNNIIKKRTETFQDSDVANFETSEVKPKKRLAMLDLLIYANRHLGTIDNDGIREEVDTFVFEGHDTTSGAICYALTLLANHQEVQRKIVEELDEIFGDSDRHATYDDLQNMKYLECCLKESLRLYPSVPFITRRVGEDITLSKHTVPANTEIFIHIFNVHRDPKYFPDPERFDPDRFLPENSLGRHPYAYIPFSAGPRNCIGQKFAMLELKSYVSSIFRKYTLEPIDTMDDLDWVLDLVLRVRGPINIKFKLRPQTINAS